jgi:hypothetical protein
MSLFLTLSAQKISIAQCDLPTNSQGDYEIKEVVNLDSVSKVSIYNSAILSFTKIFNSAKDVINVKDETAGYIIGDFYIGIPYWPGITSYFKFSIRLDFKENKYKILVNYLGHNSINTNVANHDCSCPNSITNEKSGNGMCLTNKMWNEQKCTANFKVLSLIENLKILIEENLTTNSEW